MKFLNEARFLCLDRGVTRDSWPGAEVNRRHGEEEISPGKGEGERGSETAAGHGLPQDRNTGIRLSLLCKAGTETLVLLACLYGEKQGQKHRYCWLVFTVKSRGRNIGTAGLSLPCKAGTETQVPT